MDRRLTISLPAVWGNAPDYTALRIGLRSVGAGSGQQLQGKGFKGYRRLAANMEGNVYDPSVPDDPPDNPRPLGVSIPDSGSFPVAQQYVLSVQSETYAFTMPDEDTTLNALLVRGQIQEGPAKISATAPADPVSGDIAFDATGLSPGSYSPGLNIRSGDDWYQISGGDGGSSGLNAAQVDSRIKDYARTGGRKIALGDTDFAETIEDSVDSNTISFDANTRMLSWESHDDTPGSVNIPGGGTAYDDGPLTARVGGLEGFEGALRHIRDIGTANITQGLGNALQLTSLVLPTKDEDQVVRVVVDSEGVKTFTLKSLLDKSRVNTNTQATSGNSVNITTDAPGLEVISFALRADGRVWIGDADVGTRHTFTLSIDEPDIEDSARKSSDARWSPAKLGSGSRDGSKYLRDDGTWEAPPTGGGGLNQTGVDARVRALVSDWAEQGNSSTVPDNKIPSTIARDSEIPTNAEIDGRANARVVAGTLEPARAGSATRWGTSKVPTLGNLGGLNQTEINALITAGVIDAAETGNVSRWAKAKLPKDIIYQSPHTDAVFGLLLGNDRDTDSTTIETGGTYAGDPSLATIRSIADGVWVSEQEVGPRVTNVYVAIRVPIAEDAAVQAGERSLDITEYEVGNSARYKSNTWTRKGTNVQGTFAYFTVQVADLPSGAKYLVRQQNELRLVPGTFDAAQWRHAIGVSGGFILDELDRTIVVTSAGSDVLPTAPYYFDNIDLDVQTHGAINLSLHAMLTNVSAGNPNFAFYANRANASTSDRTRIGSVTVYLSDLLQESEYVANADPDQVAGLEALTFSGYTANTENGALVLKIVRNTIQGTKRMGAYWYWRGENGSHSFHIPFEIRGFVLPTDAPEATSAGLDAAGVRGQVAAQLQAGSNITLTPSGSGAAQTLTIASTASGGGGSAPTYSTVSPQAAVDITTGGTAGAWTSWSTIVTTPALTAGYAEIEAHLDGEVTTPPSGGGDRLYVHTRLVRTRSSVDTTIVEEYDYVRNNGQSTATLNEATQQLSKSFSKKRNDFQAGDTVKLEARAISQVAARTFQFRTATTLDVTQW